MSEKELREKIQIFYDWLDYTYDDYKRDGCVEEAVGLGVALNKLKELGLDNI